MLPQQTEPAPSAEDPDPAATDDSGFWRVLAVTVAVAPPIAGMAIIGVILGGVVDERVMLSGAAMSTALAVGALLVLVPPLLYSVKPERYLEHQRGISKRVDDLFRLLVSDESARTVQRKREERQPPAATVDDQSSHDAP